MFSKALKRKVGIDLVENLHVKVGEHRVTNGREQVCSTTELDDAPLVRGAPNLSMTSVSQHYAHTSRLATYTTWLRTDLYCLLKS